MYASVIVNFQTVYAYQRYLNFRTICCVVIAYADQENSVRGVCLCVCVCCGGWVLKNFFAFIF